MFLFINKFFKIPPASPGAQRRSGGFPCPSHPRLSGPTRVPSGDILPPGPPASSPALSPLCSRDKPGMEKQGLVDQGERDNPSSPAPSLSPAASPSCPAAEPDFHPIPTTPEQAGPSPEEIPGKQLPHPGKTAPPSPEAPNPSPGLLLPLKRGMVPPRFLFKPLPKLLLRTSCACLALSLAQTWLWSRAGMLGGHQEISDLAPAGDSSSKEQRGRTVPGKSHSPGTAAAPSGAG